MARISDVVKTYKLINDPNAPSWSIKFVGAIAGAMLLVAGGAAVVYTSLHHAGPAPNQMIVASTQNGDGTKTDDIYLANFDPSLAPDYDALDAQLGAWQTAHPGATVLSETPLYDATHVHTIGYEIRYR